MNFWSLNLEFLENESRISKLNWTLSLIGVLNIKWIWNFKVKLNFEIWFEFFEYKNEFEISKFLNWTLRLKKWNRIWKWKDELDFTRIEDWLKKIFTSLGVFEKGIFENMMQFYPKWWMNLKNFEIGFWKAIPFFRWIKIRLKI